MSPTATPTASCVVVTPNALLPLPPSSPLPPDDEEEEDLPIVAEAESAEVMLTDVFSSYFDVL